MVKAIHYYGDAADNDALLHYVGGGMRSELRRWWAYSDGAVGIDRRSELATGGPVAVVSILLGPPVLIQDIDDDALKPHNRAGLFNRINFARRSDQHEKIIDANRSPVIFWQPSAVNEGGLTQGSIGSQADSPRRVSVEYERWVNRTVNWVCRRGTKVWGLQGSSVRPDLDIEVSHVSTLYALPGALALLEAGAAGR